MRNRERDTLGEFNAEAMPAIRADSKPIGIDADGLPLYSEVEEELYPPRERLIDNDEVVIDAYGLLDLPAQSASKISLRLHELSWADLQRLINILKPNGTVKMLPMTPEEAADYELQKLTLLKRKQAARAVWQSRKNKNTPILDRPVAELEMPASGQTLTIKKQPRRMAQPQPAWQRNLLTMIQALKVNEYLTVKASNYKTGNPLKVIRTQLWRYLGGSKKEGVTLSTHDGVITIRRMREAKGNETNADKGKAK
jgi:hypothetical protein